MVAVSRREDRFVDMGAYDTDFDRDSVFVGRADVGDANDLAFEWIGHSVTPGGETTSESVLVSAALLNSSGTWRKFIAAL